MLPTAPPVEGRFWPSTPPVAWPDLRGRVTIVVFWSFACESSLAVLRELADLTWDWEERHGEEVAVLAVHTPRFPFEDDDDAVEAAVLRHRIVFPVVHDPEYLTWNRYGPEGWPAMVAVDRRGKVLGMHVGRAGVPIVAEVVDAELTSNPRNRRSNDNPVPPLPTPTVRAVEHTLCFPSGVAVAPSGRLTVCDTANDRVLIGAIDSDQRTFRPEYEITDIHRPTAVVHETESTVYLIEGGRGSVLRLDLEEGSLEELVGDLASPQDLLIDRDGSLVVADAGADRLIRIVPARRDRETGLSPHRIEGIEDLVHDLDGSGLDQFGIHEASSRPDRSNEVVETRRRCQMSGTIAGSGFTGCRDGVAEDAELAQPVALARTEAGIVFADAASSNIRVLTDEGRVMTITGNRFFDWGLVDGPAHRARLQRPSGLWARDDGSVVIVDTGNNRLRLLSDRRIRTLGLAGLRHPTAVTGLPTGHLLIADTGNHRLVVADPELRTAWPLAVYPAEMTSDWEPALPHQA